MTRFILFLFLFCFATLSNAWVLIGRIPPPEHTLEAGTYSLYSSDGGANRYLEIADSEACKENPKPILPSSTYHISRGGVYKYYKSPTGVRKPWAVSYAQECYVPESPETEEPAPPVATNFVGLHKVALNPIVGDTQNKCTYAEFEVTDKTGDGRYLFRFIRLYDASFINPSTGKTECKF